MSVFNNAIQGILHMKDPEVLKELARLRDSYFLSKNIPVGTKLNEHDKKEISKLWADYLITVGGKYNE